MKNKEEVKGEEMVLDDEKIVEKLMSDEEDATVPKKKKKTNKRGNDYEKDRLRHAKMLQVHEFMLP